MINEMHHLLLVLTLTELLEKDKHDIGTGSQTWQTSIGSGPCKTSLLAPFLVKGYVAVSEYGVLAI